MNTYKFILDVYHNYLHRKLYDCGEKSQVALYEFAESMEEALMQVRAMMDGHKYIIKKVVVLDIGC